MRKCEFQPRAFRARFWGSLWVFLGWAWCGSPVVWCQGEGPLILSGIQAPAGPIRSGSRVELAVSALGDPPLVFFWFRNGELIEDIFGPVIVLDPFDESMAGTYDALVVNEFGYAVAATAELVPDLPALPFTDDFDRRAPGQSAFPNQIAGRSGSGRGSNVRATFERRGGEPNHAAYAGGRSVWVSWTPDATGVAAFGTEGSAFDTVLAVYRAKDPARPTLDSLIEVEVNDDSVFGSSNGLPAEPSSLVLFNAQAGVTYFIAVDGVGIAGDAGPLLDEFSEAGNLVLSWAMEVTDELIPDFLSVSSNQNIDVGAGFSLDARVATSTADRTEWQWWFEEQPLPGLTTAQLNLPNVSRNQVGTYFCETRNVYGNTTRSARSTTVDVQIAERSDGVDKKLQAEDRFVDARRARLAAPARGAARTTPHFKRPGNLQGLSAGASGSQIFSTKNAGKEPGEPVHCGVGGGHTKWFSIAPSDDGILIADTEGSDFDTVLAVYVDNGLGVGLFDGLVNLGCNNDAPGLGKASRLVLPVKAGDVYFLAVDGVRQAAGVAQLNFQLQQPLAIIQQPLAQTVKLGTAVTLSVKASGVGLLKFQWRKAGQAIPGATLADFRIAAFAVTDAAEYTVVVTDELSSVTSTVAKVEVGGTGAVRLTVIRNVANEYRLRGNAPIGAGQAWQIESSRDLRTWTRMATVTTEVSGFEIPVTVSNLEGLLAFRAIKL